MVARGQLESEMTSLRESLSLVKSKQDDMAATLRHDMRAVKTMLRQLLGNKATGGAVAGS